MNACLVAMLLLVTAPTRAEVQSEIFRLFDNLHQGVTPAEVQQGLWATDTLGLFYQNRDFQPAWTDYADIRSVLAELEASRLEGLNPEDYHYSILQGLEAEYLQAKAQDQRDRLRAVFDVFLTDGVLLYARHLQEGKVDPGRLEATWNYSRFSLTPAEIARRVQAAMDEGEVAARLQGFKLQLPAYDLLKRELARYRDLDARYRFQPVPADTVLRPGMSHPNVTALRTQLQRLGYTLDAVEPERFDEALANAVKDFQYLHTLAADGVVGRDTFAALNVPYADRVEQLRINLERLRWISRDIAKRMVIVNIAGFELYYFRDQALAWETDVMVGEIKHQTPLFRHNMSYLEFNPTWTVPQSIIRRSLYPKLSADPGYAERHNYKLYDRDGAEVDPYDIDWAAHGSGWFPYRIVQQPGPDNALGRVKFMFPNRYAIYLHDTPAQALFSRTSRAFSAGCIRVQDPLYFAELLLQPEHTWDRERIDAAVASAQQQVVRFSTPIEIMLMYWTASPTPDNRVQLHPDIYEKDAEALDLLNAAPVWDQT